MSARSKKEMNEQNADVLRLIELGFLVDIDTHAPEYAAEMLPLIKGLPAPEAAHDPHDIGDACKYLARLYLLAHGDNRSGEVLDMLERDGSMVTARTTMPSFFYGAYGFDAVKRVSRYSGDAKMTFEDTERGIAVTAEFPTIEEADEYNRSLACYVFFNMVMESYPTHALAVDTPSGKWVTVRRSEIVPVLLGEILDGNVEACLKCGRPVYVGRKNARPFCTKGHYNRYREAAQRMLLKGSSVEEVSERFRAFSTKTIGSWL